MSTAVLNEFYQWKSSPTQFYQQDYHTGTALIQLKPSYACMN